MDIDPEDLNISVFNNLSQEQVEEILESAASSTKTFEKGELIFHMGTKISHLAIILEGRVFLEQNDSMGDISIMASFNAGDLIAETYALSQAPVMVDFKADSECKILYIDLPKLKSHFLDEEIRNQLARNILYSLADKNITFSRKIRTLAGRSIREKLLIYLHDQRMLNDSPVFTIPYNRQELSDYLNCDRSQLSKTISKLQKEGLIKCRRNTFELLA